MWSGALENIGRSMILQKLEEQYHVYSVAYADKAHLEGGDKILLPPSAFDILARLQVDYPMLFRLQSSQKGTMTHSGVLEFTAEEGSCYIPFWMMQNLLVEEGSVISVTNVSLPKATFVKLQPQHKDFLDITNPRAVLEHALRNFSCVTRGDIICIPHNGRNYHFELQEVEPRDAACIIETDCNVDFAAPVGYKDVAKRDCDAAVDVGTEELPKESYYSINKSTDLSKISCTSGTGNSLENSIVNKDDPEKDGRKEIEIVNGMIIRADDIINAENDDEINIITNNSRFKVASEMFAKKTGMTGVQHNSAIAVNPPTEEYWSLHAGNGARLDGKTPGVIKNSKCDEIDSLKVKNKISSTTIAKANSTNTLRMPNIGTTLDGDVKLLSEEMVPEGKSKASELKFKSHIGQTYSRLKQNGFSPFEGTGNVM